MNLSRFLPGFLKPNDDMSDEEVQALADKAERIQFHRDKVRNGPVNFAVLSSGRVASQRRRRAVADNKKANRRYRRDWMRAQQDIARLRGQLEVVGALPIHDGWATMPAQAGLEEQPIRLSAKRLDHPLRASGLRGLKDGYGHLVEETLEIDQVDLGNVAHVDALIEAALHHYTIATTGRAA